MYFDSGTRRKNFPDIKRVRSTRMGARFRGVGLALSSKADTIEKEWGAEKKITAMHDDAGEYENGKMDM